MMCMTLLETSTLDLMMYAPEKLVVNEKGCPEETNVLEGVLEERRVGE
jgi:hypothetical protein